MPPPLSLRGIREAVAWYKDQPRGGTFDEGPPPPLIETHRVKITSYTRTSGRYPGTLYAYDANGDSYTAYVADDIWVKAPNGEILLKEAYYTASVVGVKASDGKHIFLVNNPDQRIKGKLDGVLNFGSTATMSVWAWNGAAEADTTENVTVNDWLLSSGQSVASGTQIWASLSQGRYYADGAQCA